MLQRNAHDLSLHPQVYWYQRSVGPFSSENWHTKPLGPKPSFHVNASSFKTILIHLHEPNWKSPNREWKSPSPSPRLSFTFRSFLARKARPRAKPVETGCSSGAGSALRRIRRAGSLRTKVGPGMGSWKGGDVKNVRDLWKKNKMFGLCLGM